MNYTEELEKMVEETKITGKIYGLVALTSAELRSALSHAFTLGVEASEKECIKLGEIHEQAGPYNGPQEKYYEGIGAGIAVARKSLQDLQAISHLKNPVPTQIKRPWN